MSGRTRHGKLFAALLNERMAEPRGAEIGVWEGTTAKQILSAVPGCFLYLVDPWEKSLDGGGVDQTPDRLRIARKRAESNVSAYSADGQVGMLHMTSLEAARHVKDGELNFFFLDGRHEYPYVRDDLRAWKDKVKRGGIYAGHDYRYMAQRSETELFPGVTRAVDEFAEELDRVVNVMPHHLWWIGE